MTTIPATQALEVITLVADAEILRRAAAAVVRHGMNRGLATELFDAELALRRRAHMKQNLHFEEARRTRGKHI